MKKVLAILALLLSVSVATALWLQLLCGVLIIGGVVVIVVEMKGCRRNPPVIPASGPVNTNAPAPPAVPASTNSGNFSFGGPETRMIITVSDDEGVFENISGVHTNLDSNGNPFHTLATVFPAKVSDDLYDFKQIAVQTWWSGTETNGEIIAVVYSNCVPVSTGMVSRASILPTISFPMDAGQAPSRFYRYPTNAVVTNLVPPPGEQSQMMMGGERRTLRTRQKSFQPDGGLELMRQMEEATARAITEREALRNSRTP